MGKIDKLFDGSNAHFLDGKEALDPPVKPLTIQDVRMWWHQVRSDIPDDDAIAFLFNELARLDSENTRLSYCMDRAGLACFMGLGREPEEIADHLFKTKTALQINVEAMRLVLAPLSVKAGISEEKLIALLDEARQGVIGAVLS